MTKASYATLFLALVCQVMSFQRPVTPNLLPMRATKPLFRVALGVIAQEETSEEVSPSESLEYADRILFQTIARNADDTVKLLLVPKAITRYYIEQFLSKIQLQPETWRRFNEMVAAEKTKSRADDFSKQQIECLADQVSLELHQNGFLQVPLLNEEQELDLLKKIMRIVFDQITTTKTERKTAQTRQQIETAQKLLDPEKRVDIVNTVSKAVDIPFFDSEKQQQLVAGAVDQAAALLEALLPPQFVHALTGENYYELAEIKEAVIEKIRDKVMVPGLSEEKEEEAIRTLVNIYVDNYVDDTQPTFYLLTQDEQVELLKQKKDQVAMEIELSRGRFEREQKNLKAKLNRLRLRLRETKRNKVDKPKNSGRKIKKLSLSGLFRRNRHLG